MRVKLPKNHIGIGCGYTIGIDPDYDTAKYC